MKGEGAMSKYMTISGDTWDLISFKHYGSEYHIKELIEANPNLETIVLFPSSMEVNIPDIDTAEIGDLPPWKQ